jgi:AcrR family transcriptional regulator
VLIFVYSVSFCQACYEYLSREVPMAEPLPEEGPGRSRRERLRLATTQEIIATARRLLVESGPDAVTLRAIAREMGMSAPALYRYYASLEELIRYVIAEIFTELGDAIHKAIHEAKASTGELADRRARTAAEMVAACGEFRRWALEHKEEFGLLFGVPLPGIDDGRYDIASECALRFAGEFFGLFLELWNEAPFPVQASGEIDQGLLAQIESYKDVLGADLPPGAILTFLRCWMLLYGGVAMEVFGHFAFALEDASAMFEYTLADLAKLVGLPYPPQS